MKDEDRIRKLIRVAARLSIVVVILSGITMLLVAYCIIDPRAMAVSQYLVSDQESTAPKEIENGIHTPTGLIDAEGLMVVVNNCTNCHSSKLVIQNRMNKERWISTIRWMQRTQNLWDLGDQEELIVNYLVTNYPPQKKGRRQTLTDIEWYELED